MLKHRLICTYLLQQHMKRLCRYHEVVSEMLQKNQKMAYVQKLYNSVYMHMRCCSEDLRYVTLKMLGNASKKIYLRKIFRFFSDERRRRRTSNVRLITPRTWLRSPRNFGNARFGRFATFDFSIPKKICSARFSDRNVSFSSIW